MRPHPDSQAGGDHQAHGPVLLIDDTPSLRMTCEAILKSAGHPVIAAADAATGLDLFARHAPRVVVLDLMLPDMDGLEVLAKMRAASDAVAVIVITANRSIDRAVEAMRAGAHEFLVKPIGRDQLLNAVADAFAAMDRRHPPQPERRNAAPQSLPPFIGRSEPMQDVYRMIRSVARSTATVFITGESGTGKELCAEAVHQLSPRRSAAFIALNCGAIPVDLLESEVFGHLKGAFTGAIADKPGAAAAADGGTLFLDEVCEMDLNLQTKLLRFLQTSTITPVGATLPRKVDVRIVCATNRDPMEEVRAGRFREDLYYRLHVVPIHMPPLRARGDDIVEMAEILLRRLAQEEGRELRSISPEVRQILRTAPWPGNVRQLLNVLRNVVVLHNGPVLRADMLPSTLRAGVTIGPASPPAAGHPAPAADGGTAAPDAPSGFAGMTLDEIERRVITDAITRHGGSITRAARELAVSPSTLYRKRAAWMDGSDSG